jgi:hypothetical protein
MLSHFGYICSNGEEFIGVKLCKNMKLEVAHTFQECVGMAQALLEPAKS